MNRILLSALILLLPAFNFSTAFAQEEDDER